MAAKRQKKKPGRILFALINIMIGISMGMGGSAYIAFFINETPVPFVTPPTRDLSLPKAQQDTQTNSNLSFFDTLRNRNQSTPASPNKPATAAKQERVYYLQAGFNQNRSIIEQLRADLVLNGFATHVNIGTLATGQAVYRLWIGPYDSIDETELPKAELALQGYQSSIVESDN